MRTRPISPITFVELAVVIGPCWGPRWSFIGQFSKRDPRLGTLEHRWRSMRDFHAQVPLNTCPTNSEHRLSMTGWKVSTSLDRILSLF